jgi:hypothetical protein
VKKLILILLVISSANLGAQVTANFSVDTSGCNSVLAIFSDSSSGNIISWDWNFGDGNTSTQQNPSYYYSGAGNSYSVKLKVSDGIVSDSIIKTNLIRVYDEPISNFSFTPLNPTINDSIQFTDLSLGAVEYKWHFDWWAQNPADTSGLVNPKHLYNVAGNYTIILVSYSDSLPERACHDTSGADIYVSFPISVNETNHLDNISIIPNPTQDWITVSLEKAKTGVLSIRNYLGQLVMKQEFNNTKELNISLDGPAGIYFLQVESDGQVITKKVVKQ